MSALLKTDVKLLRAALASNGGGINPDMHPEATRKRLMKAGLIQWKPNHCSHHTGYTSLLTITAAGKKALEGLAQ